MPDKAIQTLRALITVALTINMFLLGCEVFTEFYTDSAHVASAKYLFLGLNGYHALVPWIWTAISLNTFALVVLYTPARSRTPWMSAACFAMICGIWIEKGMGLIVPGFIPTPIGEIVEYTPTTNEVLVCFGIWAAGLLMYTILVRVTIPVLSGQLTRTRLYSTGDAS